jgi:hypothetical protein
MERREFLKSTGAAIVAGAVAVRAAGEVTAAEQEAYSGQFSAPPIDPVRIGFVGIGLQGGSHHNFLRITGCGSRRSATSGPAHRLTSQQIVEPVIANRQSTIADP